MKRMVLSLLAVIMLVAGLSATVFAEDDVCQCGTDEDGACLPCE